MRRLSKVPQELVPGTPYSGSKDSGWFVQSSLPSTWIWWRNDSEQSSASTRSTLNWVLKPLAKATARKYSAGFTPHTARSISDHVLESPLASDPNSLTLVAPNRALSSIAMVDATVNASAARLEVDRDSVIARKGRYCFQSAGVMSAAVREDMSCSCYSIIFKQLSV